MLDKMRLASRRDLTLANLLEQTARARGAAEALPAGVPAYRGLSASTALDLRHCLHLTNLAAEALIREWDLKKGERAIILADHPGELLLVSLAAIKAGGIAVPLGTGLEMEEITRRVKECGASLIIAEGAFLAARLGSLESLGCGGRLAACGPREAVPPGVVSLREAMERSSGFFLPYTLKPSSVVALFHHRTPPGKLRAVMATNEMLLWPGRVAAILPFFRPGGRFLNALTPLTMAGFAASVTAFLSHMRLVFPGEKGPSAADGGAGGEGRDVFSANPRQYSRMLRDHRGGFDAGSVGLWMCWGYGLGREEVRKLALFAAGRRRSATPVLEAYDAEGNAVMPALRLSCRDRVWPRRGLGMVIPPNRLRASDKGGWGERGVGSLAVRGPSVTPGYWNDLEATLKAKKNGWLLCPPPGEGDA